MAGVFAKLAPGIRRHPKCRDAGRDGCDVFIHVLCMNADLGATGVVPAIYLRARYIADEVMMTLAEAEEGLRRAVEAELIEILPNGAALIVGWDEEEWGRSRDSESMTEAERKRLVRAAKRAEARSFASLRTKCPDMSGHRPDVRTMQSRDRVETESETDVSASPDTPDTTVAKPVKPRKEPTGDHADVIRAWDAHYARQTGGAKASWGGKQGAAVAQLLKRAPQTDVVERMDRLFASALPWLSAPYAIGDLLQHFDKLAAVARGRDGPGGHAAQRPLRGLAAALALDDEGSEP